MGASSVAGILPKPKKPLTNAVPASLALPTTSFAGAAAAASATLAASAPASTTTSATFFLPSEAAFAAAAMAETLPSPAVVRHRRLVVVADAVAVRQCRLMVAEAADRIGPSATMIERDAIYQVFTRPVCRRREGEAQAQGVPGGRL